jgi:hypothetical protein
MNTYMCVIWLLSTLIMITHGWQQDYDNDVDDEYDVDHDRHCRATTVTSIPTVTQCPSGTPYECPEDACVNLSIDVNHCGKCKNACPITAYCLNGVCTCPPGQTVCLGECVPWNNCGSPGFSAKACIADNSIGSSRLPSMMTIFGDASFTPFQCYSACRKPATTFFTLAVDNNTFNDMNTICSCFDGPLIAIKTTLTPCPQNYGHTQNGEGSWQLFAIP